MGLFFSYRWNTAIFFPDYKAKDPNSKTAQLLWYFQEAKISIQICIYNSSLKELEEVIFEKFREGLLVEVVAGNERTAAPFREHGIKVGVYPAIDAEYLMHHKFVIFDSEAVMTGSLNWTLDVRHFNTLNNHLRFTDNFFGCSV